MREGAPFRLGVAGRWSIIAGRTFFVREDAWYVWGISYLCEIIIKLPVDMKKLFTLLAVAAVGVGFAVAQEPVTDVINLGGKDYTLRLVEKRDIGPGTTWRRLRVEEYPLNVNLVTMDMKNEWNRVETFQGRDAIGSTESIVSAAQRLSTPGHAAVAAANGNFWCVATQEPWSDLLIGTTFGGNMRNGVVITETNNASDQWCGTPLQTCVVGADANRLWIEPLVWRGYIANGKTGYLDFQQVNKVVRENEIGLYNKYYPAGKAFQPVEQYPDGNKQRFRIVEGDATEVYLNLAEGEQWVSGKEFNAVVTEVKTSAGRGTLGTADLCLVGRGENATALANLVPGDVVRISSSWTSFQTWETPQLENLIQGLALTLNNGVIDPETNQNNNYNNQVYPKTMYGADQTNTVLYIMTIDKSSDPVWGSSAGCPSWVACELLKHYGCYNAAAVDAGGSTEMFITDRIVNKTTEGTPRAVANGWMVFNTAPEDANITRIEFDDVEIRVPVYCTIAPRILGYNKYGTLIDDNVQGVTLECSEGVGTCINGVFNAASNPATGTLTARLGDVTATKNVEVVEGNVAIRLDEIVIDHVVKYPVEVFATSDGKTFNCDPAGLEWSFDEGGDAYANIDADGVLTGVKNGTTTLTGRMGDITDNVKVSVEIPSAAALDVFPTGVVADEWKCSGTSTSEWVVKPIEGSTGFGVDFRIKSTRSPKVIVARDTRLYGLPEAIEFDINPGTVNVKNVTLSLHPANADRPVTVTLTPTLEASKPNTVRFAMSDFGDTTDLGFFPVTFKSVAMTLSSAIGTYHIDLPRFQTIYSNYISGVENVAVGGCEYEGPAEYYNLHGVRVTDPAPGTVVIVRRGSTVSKIVVR